MIRTEAVCDLCGDTTDDPRGLNRVTLTVTDGPERAVPGRLVAADCCRACTARLFTVHAETLAGGAVVELRP